MQLTLFVILFLKLLDSRDIVVAVRKHTSIAKGREGEDPGIPVKGFSEGVAHLKGCPVEWGPILPVLSDSPVRVIEVTYAKLDH